MTRQTTGMGTGMGSNVRSRQWKNTDRSTERGTGSFSGTGTRPQVDMYDNGHEYVVDMDLPGCTRDTVDVKVLGNELQVTATRAQSAWSTGSMGSSTGMTGGTTGGTTGGATGGMKRGLTHLVQERNCGQMYRMVNLPTACDMTHVNAELVNGVLRVTVPYNKTRSTSGLTSGMTSTSGLTSGMTSGSTSGMTGTTGMNHTSGLTTGQSTNPMSTTSGKKMETTTTTTTTPVTFPNTV